MHSGVTGATMIASVMARKMSELLQRITINPEICGGRPTIRGMRVRVQDIIELLASGASREEILEDYPYLENDDISAALKYAAHTLNHTIIPAAAE